MNFMCGCLFPEQGSYGLTIMELTGFHIKPENRQDSSHITVLPVTNRFGIAESTLSGGSEDISESPVLK